MLSINLINKNFYKSLLLISLAAFSSSLLADTVAHIATPPTTVTTSTTVADTSAVDSAVSDTIQTKFNKDPDLANLNITIVTSGGEVMLSGEVDNPAQIEKATSLAKSTSGVTNVKSSLKIKGQ